MWLEDQSDQILFEVTQYVLSCKMLALCGSMSDTFKIVSGKASLVPI